MNTPYGGAALDSAGNLFATASKSGADGKGTVFDVAKGSNAITVLASFNVANGDSPHSSVVLDTADDVFGTTEYGKTGLLVIAQVLSN